ncbi:MAG: DUF4185 domain-containing protein [Actinomycetota bacterium]|nr:DUF4185 domain-containing protein [Actinomycetota bacterium]
MAQDGLHRLELNLHPNEASGLLAVEDGPLLEARGWDLAFWAVLDEGKIEDCVAVIGHRRGAAIGEGWEIERLHAEPIGDAGKTEDAEAVTRHGGWVYIFGSHFGSKSGPLQPKRGFVARFREDEVGHAAQDPAMGMEISRDAFLMHRLINDAFKAGGPDLIPLGPNSHASLIEATIERGERENKRWAGLVRQGDYPINVEGAAFREGGTLLLGLRFPVSAEGYPVLVELEGIERLFEAGEEPPEVVGFWVVDAVGREGEIAGVRDLAVLRIERGEELHLVTGNVDSRDKNSVLIQDYPGGHNTVATHFRCALPSDARSGTLEGEFVREFPDLPRVEGIAITDGGRFFYVTDEDEGVHLRLTRLLAD